MLELEIGCEDIPLTLPIDDVDRRTVCEERLLGPEDDKGIDADCEENLVELVDDCDVIPFTVFVADSELGVGCEEVPLFVADDT